MNKPTIFNITDIKSMHENGHVFTANQEDPFHHKLDLSNVSPLVRERIEEACQRAIDNDNKMYFIDDMEGALIGTSEVNGNVVAVYEYSLCIEYLASSYTDEDLRMMEIDEETINNPELRKQVCYESAWEWFEYNTLRTLPYLHELSPIIINGFFADVVNGTWNLMMGPHKEVCQK